MHRFPTRRHSAQLARQLDQLRQRNARLRLLAETSNGLLLTQSPQAFVRQAFERLSELLGLEVYFNYLLSDDGAHLRLDSCSGVPADTCSELARLELGDGICGAVAQERRPVVLADLRSDPGPRSEHVRALGLTVYVCLPLLAEDRLIGTLSFGSRHRIGFAPDELELLTTVCDLVAAAIDRARLIDQLSASSQRLQAADRRKDQFLAVLAHELRTPLAPILHAAQLLATHHASAEAGPGRAAAAIERQVRRMAQLVDDLLDVSRVRQGKVRLARRPLVLGEVVEHALQTSRVLLEQSGVIVEVHRAEEPVRVSGDPNRLEQVLCNLLSNACRHTPPGGRVEIEVDVRGGEAHLRVRDTDAGIAPEDLPHVFDLFHQAESDGGGLGIGLTLVRTIVELHGGRVSASSEGVGRGTAVSVVLPLRSTAAPEAALATGGPAAAAPPEVLQPPGAQDRPLQVLVVEDNADGALLLAALLETMGYEAHIANTGSEGLELARRLRPDTVVMDLGLPGMDGYEVARRMRADPELEGIHLIALSGYSSASDRRRAYEAGFDVHLAKPAEADALQRTLTDLGRAA